MKKKEKNDFSTLISETSGNVYLFVFLSMIGFLWSLYLLKYFFDLVRNKLGTITIYTRSDKKKIKSWRKEYVIRMCFKFWQMKIIFRKLSAVRVWLWFIYKFTDNYCRWRLFFQFIQTQKKYPISIDKTGILTYNVLVIWT